MNPTTNYLKPFTLVLAFAVLSLAGCGDGGGHHDYGADPAPKYTTQIMSDPAYDGDIEQVTATTYAVTQGMSTNVQSVFAGIDPVAMTEFRAFLNFPLTGAIGVPGNAIIDTA